MPSLSLYFLALLTWPAEPVNPGNYTRTLTFAEQQRAYHVHVPPSYDGKKPVPVVLALHGATMNGRLMEWYCGLDQKADEAGFVVVYPNGTGPAPILLAWNAGPLFAALSKNKVDDVAFLGKVLDDVAEVVNVDSKRVFATGISNGGMMCYRLAAELSDRIAAVAPVAGTMAIEGCAPKRPVPVLHIHGTADNLVPYEGPSKKYPAFVKFQSVEESVAAWVKINGCKDKAETAELPTRLDKYKVVRKCYNSGKDGAEVILFTVEQGGHSWPGQPSPGAWLGPATRNVIANDVIWEFFCKHPMK